MNNKLKRLKENLIKNMKQASHVFIIGHNNPDYDAIGAAIGVATLAKSLGIKAYIIVNDAPQVLEPGVKKVIDDSKEKYQFINLEEFRQITDKKSLLVTVDVNKKSLTAVANDLDNIGKVMIIDHHQEDEFSIPTPNKYIDQNSSSTCEIITQLLQAKQVKYTKDIANYLLAGIILDTNRFQKTPNPSTTFDIAEKLCRKGADYDAINKLFISNFLEDDQIYSLIFGKKKIIEDTTIPREIVVANTHIQAYPQLFGEPTVSFTVNRTCPKCIYRQDELAKTADKMLKYADMSFVLGYVSEQDVGISARSKCEIDVGEVLRRVEKRDFPLLQEENIGNKIKTGGGNKRNAGGRITTNNIYFIEKILMDLVLEMSLPNENSEEIEKPVELVKKKELIKVR